MKISVDQFSQLMQSIQTRGHYQGIVVVKVESGLIKHWREYQHQSELSWEKFTSHKPF